MLPFLFSAWMVWDDPASVASLFTHLNQLTVVSIESQTLTKTGELQRPGGFSPKKKNALINNARIGHVQIYALIANQGFDPTGVELKIATSESRHAHAVELASTAQADGFAGIDLDYESLKAGDRENFSAFVAELGKECHSRSLKLAIALQAKDSEPGSWDGVIAEDYKAIGQSVDFARIMTYDEHWKTSEAGPVASNAFVERIATFAASVIPPEKIDLGLPGYGYDWDTAVKGSHASSISFTDFQKLIAAHGPAQRDASGELKLSYGTHQVWFPDAQAAAAKFALAKKLRLHGVTMWRLGTEDPATWPTVAAEQKTS
jgi:spore germination protein YaaH